jgi:regulator of replication initiation timing
VAKTAVITRTIDIEAIDRLEEKVKLLVGMVDRLRTDHARAMDDNARLGRELEGLRARIAEAEEVAPELTALKEERDLIRSRVTEMLEQIEALNL